jgi:hypothetical protein
MAPRRPTVLVVTEDPEPSQAMSGWLREAGLRVITCPGPQPPTYVCAGGSGDACPLAVGADVVVLDLWLASDTMLRGTPALQLLSYYLDLGKPVVALQHLGGPPGQFAAEGVELVPSPATRRMLLDALHHRLPGSQAHAMWQVRKLIQGPSWRACGR